jgi:hypothetical protein
MNLGPFLPDLPTRHSGELAYTLAGALEPSQSSLVFWLASFIRSEPADTQTSLAAWLGDAAAEEMVWRNNLLRQLICLAIQAEGVGQTK